MISGYTNDVTRQTSFLEKNMSIMSSGLTVSESAILLSLQCYAVDRGKRSFFMKVETLISKCPLSSKEAIRKALLGLQTRGLIVRKLRKKRNKSNRFIRSESGLVLKFQWIKVLVFFNDPKSGKLVERVKPRHSCHSPTGERDETTFRHRSVPPVSGTHDALSSLSRRSEVLVRGLEWTKSMIDFLTGENMRQYSKDKWTEFEWSDKNIPVSEMQTIYGEIWTHEIERGDVTKIQWSQGDEKIIDKWGEKFKKQIEYCNYWACAIKHENYEKARSAALEKVKLEQVSNFIG